MLDSKAQHERVDILEMCRLEREGWDERRGWIALWEPAEGLGREVCGRHALRDQSLEGAHAHHARLIHLVDSAHSEVVDLDTLTIILVDHDHLDEVLLEGMKLGTKISREHGVLGKGPLESSLDLREHIRDARVLSSVEIEREDAVNIVSAD